MQTNNLTGDNLFFTFHSCPKKSKKLSIEEKQLRVPEEEDAWTNFKQMMWNSLKGDGQDTDHELYPNGLLLNEFTSKKSYLEWVFLKALLSNMYILALHVPLL